MYRRPTSCMTANDLMSHAEISTSGWDPSACVTWWCHGRDGWCAAEHPNCQIGLSDWQMWWVAGEVFATCFGRCREYLCAVEGDGHFSVLPRWTRMSRSNPSGVVGSG